MVQQLPQLVLIAPQIGADKPKPSPRALMRLDGRGVPTMNSQLPLMYPTVITDRMEAHLSAAETARALRGVTKPQGPIVNLRRLAANALVRIGQRLNPAVPERQPASEHVLIELAR
jgi:4'-phosphopantetheinyl transferase EntD